MAVDMALWTLLATTVGFIAYGCIITRNTANRGLAATRR